MATHEGQKRAVAITVAGPLAYILAALTTVLSEVEKFVRVSK